MKKILKRLGIGFLAYVAIRTVLSVPVPVLSSQIVKNAGFEYEWESWDQTGPDGNGSSISNEGHYGLRSAKITDAVGGFEQTVPVEPGRSYELVAYVYGSGKIGVVVSGETLTAETNGMEKTWVPVSLQFETDDEQEVVVFAAYREATLRGVRTTARFDDFAIKAL